MAAWTKIASVFLFSASAAILGVACNASVEAPEDTTDAPALETQDVTTSTPLATPEARDHGRDRCERACHDEYRECASRPRSDERRCHGRENDCMHHCRH